MGNSTSCRAISLRDVVDARSQREASDKSQSPSSKSGSKKKGSKKRLVFNFTDVSELDDILEEIELALNDVLENKVVKRKTSEALQTNLNDVGTMLESSDVRAVVLHGLPEIGKSTLGDAVYARLNFPGRTHCRIEVGENPSFDKICSLQASILERLSGEKVKLGYPLEGRHRLGMYLEECRDSLFIYIDNVFNPNDLQDLLPEKLILPPKSRVLVTSVLRTSAVSWMTGV